MRSHSSVPSLMIVLCATIAAFTGTCAAQPSDFVAGFDDGSDDGFAGNAFFEASGGNPGGNAHFMLETFGIEIRTGQEGGPSNPSFLGDYSGFGPVVFGVDVQVDLLDFFGTPVSRNLGVVLIDRDIQGPSGPSGVWFSLGVISETQTPDWTHFEVTIDDPTQSALPPGWIGFGDEDPETFETILPKGATFATILASVDEVRISTFEPGFFFGFTQFDTRVDNVSVGVSSGCPADLDGSGAVDFADILAILGVWGSTGGPEDLDGSGTVDFGDLLAVLGSWGPCP